MYRNKYNNSRDFLKRTPSFDRGYGSLSSSRSHGSLYDTVGTNYGSKYGGTGKSTAYLSPSYGSPKPYTPSQRESSYTSNSRDKSYTPGAIPRDKAYTPGSREKSYTPGNRYSGYSVGGVGVRDRMQKFSGGDSRGSKDMYTPIHSVRGNSQSRDNPGWDKYSSRSAGSDPYANRTGTGYLSDYGGSNRSLASWDRASSKSGRSYDRPSRESSPVSSKLSSYGDYMSASPYSTYDSSPSLSRRYERQQSVDPPRREPDDSYTRRRDSTSDYIKPPAPKRREQITSDESDTNDSAPEAEKDGYKGRLKISRGTSPMHEGEPPRREQKKNKIRDRKAIARTKRIRNTTREIRRENIYKEFREMADAAVQTNDVSPRRRGRRVVNDSDDIKDKAALAAMAMLDDSGGANGPNDSFYKSRDKFNDPSVPASPSYTSPDQNNKIFSYRDNESVHDIPGEKSWRKSVYGDSETEDKRSSRQNPRTSTPMSAADKRSSRISQVSDRESRPDYNRSSSRENILDENPNRRRRTNSRELLDETVGTEEQPPPLPPRRLRHGSREILDAPEAPLTSETISLRDSIAKVHEWKQQLPEPDSYYGDRLTAKPMKGRRLDGMAPSDHSEEYFSAHDYPPPPPPHQKTTSRDVSPDRGRTRDQRSSGGYYRTDSRTDSVRSPRENSPSYSRDTSPNRLRQRPRRNLSREQSFDNVFDDDKDPRLPNKDFRKSALNKSESNYFENGDPDGVRYRRQDSVPKKGNRKSGSSSDAFSREGSREDIIDDRRPRRDGHTSDSSNFGFNREGSPNRIPGRRVKSRQNSREDMLDDRKSSRPSSREGMIDDHRSSSRSASRHNSREDVLDDRGKRFSARDRPHSLAVSNESLAHLSNEGSLRSVNSIMTDDGTVKNVSPSSAFSNENQALPDVVNGGISPKQLNSPRKDKSGYINQRQDIDHVLDEVQGAPADLSRRIGHRGPRPASTDGYYMDSKNIDEVLNRRSQNLMDTPVPKTPTPLKPSPQVLEEKLIDIDSPITPKKAAISNAPPNRGADARMRRTISETGQQMWDTLKKNKGSVTITDILRLCEKPTSKVIRVPGVTEGFSDINFKGYPSANEMLENMGVDVKKLEDCALQIYRYHNGTQGDYGTYLDLETNIDEQVEELEGFQDHKKQSDERRKNALILRTQLTVRVHAVIEKLLNSHGRELRRALFSLKQIFQDDKDLVHEFVNNDGLDCLIKVGSEADQNYQNYILRALGQVMLYVDGMNGVINHNETIQWLYSLLSSKFRLVVKTSLKLLLVFVEYTETNTMLLLQAINTVDKRRGLSAWTNVMSILDEKDGGDTELLIYSMTLVNKVLNAIPDQDTFYDVTDALEELDMERVTQRHMHRNGADLDLISQFQLYEAALKHEDRVDDEDEVQAENLRRTPRIKSDADGVRKSRRFSTGLQKMPPKHRSAPLLSIADEQKPGAERYAELKNQSMQNAMLPPEHIVDQMPDPNRKRRTRLDEMTQDVEDTKPPDKMFDMPKNIQVNGTAELSPKSIASYGEENKDIISCDESVKDDDLLSVVESKDDLFSIGENNEDDIISMEESAKDEDFDDKSVDLDVKSSMIDSSDVDMPRSRRDRRERQRSFLKDQEHEKARQRVVNRVGDRSSVASTSSTSTCSSDNNTPPTVDIPRETTTTKYSSVSSPSDNEHHNRLGDDGRQKSQGYSIQTPNNQNDFETRNNQINGCMNNNGLEANNNDINDGSSNSRWLKYMQKNKEEEEKAKELESQERLKSQQQIPDVNLFKNRGEGLSQLKDTLQQNSGGIPMFKPQVESYDDLKIQSNIDKFQQIPDNQTSKDKQAPTGDRSGLISRALEGLNKPSEPSKPTVKPTSPEILKTESDLQWDKLQKRLHRPLKIKDLDFTDLGDDEDVDIFAPVPFSGGPPGVGGIPPPPPPPGMCPPAPPPPPGFGPPPPPGAIPPPPPPMFAGGPSPVSLDLPPPPGATLKKNKKTLKLHWKTIQAEMPHPSTKGDTVWKDLIEVKVDPEKIEHLFETRMSEIKQKKAEASGKKEINVLDAKRSNAINIGLTVLPPPRTIKAGILKMDNSIMNKEGIEKILTSMIPTEEEKGKILEAQMANPDIPLGQAEQFLLTLSSISELQARLSLWLFKLDYEIIEGEVAEPLSDLKKGTDELRNNKTFKCILSVVLTIGNFLNGASARGFSIEYLTKIPEVKDTVHKHSLLHHLCSIINEQFPDTTDLYSDIGTLARCSRIDWDELSNKLNKLESDCKASWDHLRAIAKHDGSSNSNIKSKLSEFLADAAERIMILKIVHKRVSHRYIKLLLYMGLPAHTAKDLKVNAFCKIVSEFALEYRTTREKVIQQLQKRANQRERKKTRGKMIVDTEKFSMSNPKETRKDDELHKILSNGYVSCDDRGFPGQKHRSRRPLDTMNKSSRGCVTTDSEMYDTGDDDLLEACVRTATAAPTSRAPRERKRAKNHRKSSERRTSFLW